jgi:nucleoside-diphosphate-sugar epimerase
MSPLAVPRRPDLIVGCGYLGRRVAARWLAAGRRVVALTRHNAAALAAIGVEPVVGDVLDAPSLRQLPGASTVLYAVGLDRTSGASMHNVYVGGLANVLGTLSPCDRFIYVSSTSVYGKADGGWVDEMSPAEPVEESGRVVLEAERLLRTKRPDAIVLRFGGIYGPDRLLRRESQLRAAEPMTGDPGRWLNLIHVDDGVEAVLSAELRGAPGATYNIVDDTPAPRGAFYEHLAELFGAPAPRFVEGPEPRQANRRVSNARAKAELGWQAHYPSYREGLPASLGKTTTE